MAKSTFASGILIAFSGLAPLLVASSQVKVAAPKQAERKSLETFAGTLEQAKASAKQRNVPLLVIGILEEEPFDEKEHHDVVSFRTEVLENAGLAAASAMAVVVLANNRVHPQTEVVEERDGVKTKRKVCSVYKTGECALHKEQFEQLYAAYNVNGDLRLPFASVHAPSGELELRMDSGHAPNLLELQSVMQAVSLKAGEGLSVAALAQVLELLEKGSQARATKPGEALVAYEGVLALTKTTTYATEAREQQAALLKSLEPKRNEALELLRTGKVAEGYAALEILAQQTQGSELAKELQLLLRKAETDKETRDAVRAFKRERDSEALFKEAEQLYESGNAREGAKKARQLMQRFAGTPAAERAKLKWPELVREA